MLQSYHNKFLNEFKDYMPESCPKNDHIRISRSLDDACTRHGEDSRVLCDRLMNNPKFHERFTNQTTSVADNEIFEKRLTGWVNWKDSVKSCGYPLATMKVEDSFMVDPSEIDTVRKWISVASGNIKRFSSRAQKDKAGEIVGYKVRRES